jgi:hypothetical protein
MDPKATILVAIGTVVASIGGAYVVTTKEKPPIQAASGSALDKMAAAVASTAKGDAPTQCCRERCQRDSKEVTLHWGCNGEPVNAETEAELDKLAEDDTTCIRFPSRLVGDVMTLDHQLVAGEKPNTDPVPEAAEEVKPAEDLKQAEGSTFIPVGK